MLCVDIYLEGEIRDKVERIRERVACRTPRHGSMYFYDVVYRRRRSCVRGGEKNLLVQIAQAEVSGTVYDVDGIFTGGINVSVSVSEEEAERMKSNPSYHIKVEMALS